MIRFAMLWQTYEMYVYDLTRTCLLIRYYCLFYTYSVYSAKQRMDSQKYIQQMKPEPRKRTIYKSNQ